MFEADAFLTIEGESQSAYLCSRHNVCAGHVVYKQRKGLYVGKHYSYRYPCYCCCSAAVTSDVCEQTTN